tara:strand:- start:9335 stop:9574 length:240 start_codon:yes stop_codon:yes gene_type:complete
MEPPVSISAETLLNSINFLPVAGVQLAALDTAENPLFGFLFFVASGSFLPKDVIVLMKKSGIKNNACRFIFKSYSILKI